VISDVATSGPIARFGFQEGDQIVSINGQRITTEREFIDLLVSPQIQNQRVQIVVWRDDQRVPVWVEPWVLMQSESSTYAQADPLEPLGIVLDDRYQTPVVWKVTTQSPAYYSGIRSGDVIVAWNRQYVSDHQDLINLVQQTQANEFPVQISRNRQLRVVTLEVDGQGRTALRPTYDQASSTTDGAGTYSQGTFYQQRTYTQPGTTYVQPGSMYVQPGATYSQPGYSQPGTYNQPQGRPALLPRLRGR
jgi:S1-C subfamily serine protease